MQGNATHDKKQNVPPRIRSFLKSFMLTSVILSVIITVGYFAWNTTVTPPETPPLGLMAMPPVQRPSNPDADLWEWVYDGFEGDTDAFWPAPERFTDGDRRGMFWTFLIIGLNEGTNVNTAMVASYCGITRTANLISIPRDAPVHATRRGRKLSSSYLAGAGGGRGRAGGVAQVQRDIMGVIGFVPDFYVVIDYDTFFTIVDAIGGIEIYVPMRMRYDDPWQDLVIDIMPGLQHMDGRTALEFSRFRRANRGYAGISDYQRMENQQAVVNAVLTGLLRPSNILRIPEFVGIFNESVYTNLSFSEMMWFALELNHIRGAEEPLSTYTFQPIGPGQAPHFYEFLDPRAALALINRTINPFNRNLEARDLNIITG